MKGYHPILSIAKARFILLLIIVLTSGCRTTFAQKVSITRTGKKYHLSTCRYLKYSSIEVSDDRTILSSFSKVEKFAKARREEKTERTIKAYAELIINILK